MQVTRIMRSKEEANDYRYFPEPDLVRVVISDERIAKLEKEMPETKIDKMARFLETYGIKEYDAQVLSEDIELANYFEVVAKTSNNGKSAANWVLTEVLRVLKDSNKEIEAFQVSSEDLGELITLIDNGTISSKIAKEVFAIRLTEDKKPSEIVKEKGLNQVADTGAIEVIVDKVLANNPKMIEDYKASDEGKRPRVLKGLMGQVMKETGGKANPQIVTDLLTAKLS